MLLAGCAPGFAGLCCVLLADRCWRAWACPPGSPCWPQLPERMWGNSEIHATRLGTSGYSNIRRTRLGIQP
eukprot:3955947-Lingulodinium_polyedra.AAC.1